MKARTAIQDEANRTDLDAFNLACRIEGLAERTGSSELRAAVRQLNALRRHIRVHMHHDDITETANS